jgi:hypothetical protein
VSQVGDATRRSGAAIQAAEPGRDPGRRQTRLPAAPGGERHLPSGAGVASSGVGAVTVESAAVAQGLAAYHEGRFFAAHEAWEAAWLATAPGPRREQLQALIQVAAALHGARVLGRRVGPLGTMRKAARRLRASGEPVLAELDRSGLLAAVEDWITAVASGADPGVVPVPGLATVRR